MTAKQTPRAKRYDRVVNVRLTDEVWELVEHVAQDFGCTTSEAVRLMLQRTHGADADIADAQLVAAVRDNLDGARDAFNEASLQLQRVGSNINQIARAANSGNLDAVTLDALNKIDRHLDAIRWDLDRDADGMLNHFKAGRTWLS